MSTWDELRAVLLRLREEQPDLLLAFPNPYSDRPKAPPFHIDLAPTAETLAEDLHQRFGDDLKLTVGSLPYPSGRQNEPPTRSPHPVPELLDPHQITVELDGPAIVRSGHTGNHGLLVKNLTGDELQIPATNGQLTASVVDPSTGEIVGGFAGAQALLLRRYRVAEGTVERIPLLIGTASVLPRLGYTVPPGSWGIQTVLDIGPDPQHALHKRTPILPLEITE